MNGAPKTCEKQGLKNENCTSNGDCSAGMSCINLKCSNLNGRSVGEVCSTSSQCDSGLCLEKICSLNYTTITCSSDSSCSSYESKCSCGSGRSSSSSSYGTCASLKRCQIYKSILSTCLANNGRGVVASNTLFDRNSAIHRACAKEFSQYYSCLRIGYSDAGNVQPLPISGLDINIQLEDPAVSLPTSCDGYESDNPNVCSGYGDCVANNVCKCYSGFSGTFCQTRFTPQKSTVNPTPTPNKSVGDDKKAATSGGPMNLQSSVTLWMVLICVVVYIILH